MALSEPFEAQLRLASRRAYERGRVQGAALRGMIAATLAMPGFLLCGQTALASACLAGFGLAVAAGRFRGGSYEDGSRVGALAGLLPCLLPAAISAFHPEFCLLLHSYGLWVGGVGGVAAGTILALRGRPTSGWPFWVSAITAFGFAACLGCLPAGAIGFAGLGLGVIVGGTPVFALRRGFI